MPPIFTKASGSLPSPLTQAPPRRSCWRWPSSPTGSSPISAGFGWFRLRPPDRRPAKRKGHRDNRANGLSVEPRGGELPFLNRIQGFLREGRSGADCLHVLDLPLGPDRDLQNDGPRIDRIRWINRLGR